MSRIETIFKNAEKPCLVTFSVGCDPNYQTSLDILLSMADNGADIIEIGMPFTDPMADGETIQKAAQRALEAGGSLKKTLQLVRDFRSKNNNTPLILMGYMNPIFVYGIEQFCADARNAGVDGMIVVDLPPEESDGFFAAMSANDLDFIRLITPTTNMDRLETICTQASGFLYYVSITGVTGTAKADPAALKSHIDQIKSHTELPVVVGFGIKTPEDATAMGAVADGVVVGSALVSHIAKNPTDKGLPEIIRGDVSALKAAL